VPDRELSEGAGGEDNRVGGPTVRRMLLGSHLRRLRESKGISRDEAGKRIRASDSKISRMELGRVGFKERDVADLLTLYGVRGKAERATLLELVREANRPGWWQNLSDVLPPWFHPYMDLEEAAAVIRIYQVQFIPGLLQTEDYARAVIRQGDMEVSTDTIERLVGARMNRQRVLTRPDPPRLWVVVDEAALRRPIGGPKVMRAQLEQLITLNRLPNLTLQIMPFSVGCHAAEGGAFSILRFSQPDLPDVVYLEHLAGATYLDKREAVARYKTVMERLVVESAPPDTTANMIDRIIESGPEIG
jgi:transcriptional regulator with XRE-family HTH domain